MTFEMFLDDEPYKSIKYGQKTVEMRLNDERRKDLKAFDKIIFTNRLTNEKMTVEIIEVKAYKDFYELYKEYDKKEIGYKDNEIANPKDMEKYYSIDMINKYGALAIRIKKL